MPANGIFSPWIEVIPGGDFVQNFVELQADTGFLRTLTNSIVVALVYTAASVLLTSMAGWALVRYRFLGRGAVLGIILGTLTLPYFVVVIPQYILVARDFGLANSWFGLIVPPLFNSLGVLFMRQTFTMMPRELFDAAQVEGVSEWKIFTRVALPMAKPTLAALSIILFLASWNNYLWPLLISSAPEMMTAPVALGTLIGVTRVSWGAERAHRLLALVTGRAVEDQDAVEVVHLVLEHARLEARRLDQLLVAVLVAGAYADVDGTVDLDEHAGQRQAALLERLALLAGPLEHRVHDGRDRRVRVDAVHEHAVHDADLGGGEADAEGVVHDLAHAADLLGEPLVERRDLERAAAQDGVAVLADELEGGVAPGSRLRVDPVAERLGFLLRAGRYRVLVGHRAGKSIAGRRRR
jgi:lactose/L-arabinose transport system permease protein